MPTALITGGSSGIGLALAGCLAQDRHDLVLVGRDGDRLARAAAELSATYRVAAIAIPADLREPDSPDSVWRELERRQLTIDVLVNGAGVGLLGRFAETDLERDVAMLRLNVEALVRLTKLALPGMLARRRGRIVNLSSTAALQPGPYMSVYYATKAFVLWFSEALAHEVTGTGVQVTAVCPGPTTTRFTERAGLAPRPLQRPFFMSADRVARIAYRGIRRGRRVVIPGLRNRLLAGAVRLVSRRWATAVVGLVNARAGAWEAGKGPVS